MNNDISAILLRIKDNLRTIKSGTVAQPILEEIDADFHQMMELIKLFLISERDSYYGFIMMNLSFRAAFSSTGIAGILLNEFPPVFQSNPLLLCEFSLKEIIYVVCHEIDHILLNHPSEMVRLGQDDPDLMMKFNLAADAAVNDRINDEIKSRGYKFMRQPEGTITSDVLAEMFKLKSIAHAENYRYYFDLIKGRNNPEGRPQNQPQRMLEGIGDQPDTESTGSSGDGNEDQGQTIITVNNAGSLSDHDWQVNGDEEDADAAVRELVNAAVDMMNDEARGLMPGHFMSQVELLNRPPKLTWQQILKRYVGTISAEKRKTRTRLNRRQPGRFDLSGSMDDKVLKIIVAIDTSASVDDEMISSIINEIFAILAKRKHEITILECDSKVQRVYRMDKNSISIRNSIAKCIWKSDEFDNLIEDQLKIDSQVSTDEDKGEFMAILRTGIVQKEYHSRYAKVFSFFQDKIDEFIGRYPAYCAYLPARIMYNCILLPIEAETQDTALRIFSTLNDRGLPLSDSDIFKAQFYKYYSGKGQKDQFITKWKALEALCESIFHPISGTPMDEIFTRYMYYERAKQGIKSSTTEALRKFYERNSYALLKNDQTFENLIDLADFWNDVQNQSIDRFSDRILRRLFVFNYAPNSMWTYFVSVYYMANKDSNGMLDDEAFYQFLNKTIAFVWAYAVTNPGVNALRTPLFAEMINIVEGKPITFSDFLFHTQQLQNAFQNYVFSNNRAITKSMLTWWAYQDPAQELLSPEITLEIEHIYARNRQEKEHSLSNPRNVESLGNKALLEKRINIRASDYRFADKTKYYVGFENARKQKKDGTKIRELRMLADTATDFTESDIVQRHAKIIFGFVEYMNANQLLRND